MDAGSPLSVVCCVKDGERHLEAFEACLTAAWSPEYELVLLDDGSTDSTPDVFARWATLFPRVVHVRNERSQGLGAAQVRAVAAATGERLWIIDCDDRFPADGPARLLAAATRTGADVVVGRARSTDGTSGDEYQIDARSAPESLTGAEALERMLTGAIEGYTWTKLYRRALFDDAPDLPTPTTQCDFVRTSLAVARSARVELIEDEVYTYIRHGSSLMDRKDPPLDNLVVARNHLVGLVHERLAATRARRRLVGTFTTWFLAASAVKIPLYVHAGPASVAHGLRIAATAMRTVRVADVLRTDRKVGAQAALLRLSPALYRAVFARTLPPALRR